MMPLVHSKDNIMRKEYISPRVISFYSPTVILSASQTIHEGNNRVDENQQIESSDDIGTKGSAFRPWSGCLWEDEM